MNFSQLGCWCKSGHETNYSPQYYVEVKIAWSYISTLLCAFMAWCSVKLKPLVGRNWTPILITTTKWKIRRVTEVKLGEHRCNL